MTSPLFAAGEFRGTMAQRNFISLTALRDQIRDDFDRIALVSQDDWDHNGHYHRFLLNQVPERCAQALDIGCGTGVFSRLLAARLDQVLGLDLSPEMIIAARDRSQAFTNIDFQIADFLESDLPESHFDVIVSIAAMHHLPLAETLTRIKRALKPNGVMLILDLYKAETVMDFLVCASAVPLNIVFNLYKNHRAREPKEKRQAWAEHGQRDVYQKLSQIREISSRVMPGSRLQRHLFWRYSLVWQKPEP